MIAWIEESVFRNHQRDALIDDAAFAFASLLHYSNLESPVKTRLVEDLVHCEKLGPAFWLATAPPMSAGRQGYEQWNARFVSHVETEACKVLAEPGSSPQLMAQAALLLSIFNGELYTRGEMPAPSVPAESVAARLSELVHSPKDMLTLVDVEPSFAGETLPRTLNAGPIKSFQLDKLLHTSMNKACLAAELLKLVSMFDLPLDQPLDSPHNRCEMSCWRSLRFVSRTNFH